MTALGFKPPSPQHQRPCFSTAEMAPLQGSHSRNTRQAPGTGWADASNIPLRPPPPPPLMEHLGCKGSMPYQGSHFWEGTKPQEEPSVSHQGPANYPCGPRLAGSLLLSMNFYWNMSCTSSLHIVSGSFQATAAKLSAYHGSYVARKPVNLVLRRKHLWPPASPH